MGKHLFSLAFGLIFVSSSWVSTTVHAQPKQRPRVLLIGFWNPTGEMLRRYSPDTEKNREGWKGENWEQSGYDVVSYFPEFADSNDRLGSGDFRVDFAAVYNDFHRVVEAVKPVAIVAYGAGGTSWDLEAEALPHFQEFFKSGIIPSLIGERPRYAIDDALKSDRTYISTLPMEQIAETVNHLPWIPEPASIHKGGPSTFICGFMAYLLGWYQEKHRAHDDPQKVEMAGFIHVNLDLHAAFHAQEQTLATVIETMARRNQDLRAQVAMDAARLSIFSKALAVAR